MRHLTTAGVLAASIVWATGAFASEAGVSTVAVRLYDTALSNPTDLAASKAAAEAILRQAGVEPLWIECARAEAGDSEACARGLGAAELAVRVVKIVVPANYRGTLPMGDAFVDVEARAGSLATIYLDRVQWLASAAGTDVRTLLGRAIAHEIGHLLLGTNTHRRSGLMRARWTSEELRRLIPADWVFTREDAVTIRRSLSTRSTAPLMSALR